MMTDLIALCVVSLVGFGFVLVTALTCVVYDYYSCLNRAKKQCKYQTMSYSLLKSICVAVGDRHFLWRQFPESNRTKLLFYRKDCCTNLYLINVSFVDAARFSIWQQQNNNTASTNETDEVLTDIQDILKRKISDNEKDMYSAAIIQKKSLENLSHFAKDYIKSQVEIEG